MKKVLFLLLLTVSSYGQALFDKGIKVTTNINDTLATKVVVKSANNVYNYQDISEFQKEKGLLSTGLLKNGAITINGDPTKFNVTAGIGIISNFDDPSNPISTIINFPAFTGITPTYLTTGNITYVAINSTPAVVMQATPFTAIQRRDLIELGAVIHSNLTTINVINNLSSPIEAGTNQLHDLFDFIGALNLSGNVYSANGANLQLNKSAGIIGKRGINFINNWKDPHRLSQGQETALTFRYRTQNGTEGTDRINLDPALYDLNNVLTAVPNNKFTIQTVVMFQTGLTRILYGQNVYDDLQTAINAVLTRSFVIEPNSKENGIIRSYVIMKNTTTSLQNVADAKILEAQKFGGVASGGVALTLANIVTALSYTPANDIDVLHKTGNETKTGILTIGNTLNLSNISVNSTNGFITKNSQPYIHNFYAGANPTGGTGNNINIGVNSGNFNSDNLSYASTMVGFESGLFNKNGYSNTGIGYYALRLNENGFGNTAVGTFTQGNSVTGTENTSLGWHAMLYRTGGGNNVGAGVDVLRDNVSGSFNTAYGSNAGATNIIGSGNVFIGYAAGFVETGSDKLYISNNSTSNPIIKGDFSTNELWLRTGGSKLKLSGSGVSLTALDLTNGYDNFYLDGFDIRFKTAGVERMLLSNSGGVKINSLAGIGTRTVVADASGNLSATEQVFSGSSSLNFPSTPAGQSNELSFSVSGASDGDLVILGIPSVSENANSCYTARVSSANNVAVKFNNYSALAIDPAVGTFKVKVLK